MIRKSLIALFIIPAISVIGTPAGNLSHVDTYRVDTQNSKVEWFAEKVTGKHNGTIAIKSGELHNNHGKFAGKFTMDMNTITVSDLTGSSKTKLEKHLHSADFFHVGSHPESEFELLSLTPLSGIKESEPNFNVKGTLTIKGISQPVTFPATIKFNGKMMTAIGEAVVDRSKFDIRYGSKSFFADIGDKAIYDEFRIRFSIVASM